MNPLNLSAGYRLTKPRQIVLEELQKHRCHLTAYDIYRQVKKRLPRVSLGTVYRNLKFLQNQGYIMGLVCSACDYEHFDGFTDHHQHFTCLICKKVYDLRKSLIKKVKLTRQEGHQINDYQLNLTGICQSCLKKKKTSLISK